MKPFYTNVIKYGNNLLYRGVNESGVRIKTKILYRPTLFIPTQKDNTKYKTLDNIALDKVKPGSMGDCYEFQKKYKDVEGFDIYGIHNWPFQFISNEHPEENIEFDLDKICIGIIDIETTCEDGFPDPEEAVESINAITFYESTTKTYWAFGVNDYGKCEINKENQVYIGCSSEADMLRKFLMKWKEYYPDILSGWNCIGFDVPFIVNRMFKILGEKATLSLSPWDLIKESTYKFSVYSDDKITYKIMGVAILDYMELYKKFTYKNQESYSLDHISHVELGEKKLDYSEYGSLHTLYLNDYQKFMEYNIKDVELIVKLEDKMRLMELAVSMAYMSKVNFENVYSPVRVIETMMYNQLLRDDIILPPYKHSIKTHKFAGAYVKEPQIGMHDWIVSFDLNSLYPSLIIQMNISPETFRPEEFNPDISVDSLLKKKNDLSYLEEKSLTLSANGHHFTRDKQGFIPKMVENLYSNRRKTKDLMLKYQKKAEAENNIKIKEQYISKANIYKIQQQVAKVLLNSIYGGMGNQYFLFYDTRLAEAITLQGQYTIKFIEQKFNNYFNKILDTDDVDCVAAVDTDSNYLILGRLVKKVFPDGASNDKIVDFLDKACKQQIEPYIEKSYKELADYTNAYKQAMVMGREVIASKGLWTGKKRYALNVHDNEDVRYKEPKLKIMGLEVVKSSTPEFCRNKLKEAIRLIMYHDEQTVQKFINETREEYYNLNPADMAFPRGVNGLKKWASNVTMFKKSTPIHVKGSIIYNHIIDQKNLGKEYQKILEGNKIKFILLKEPNPAVNSSVLSFPNNTIPKEFDIDGYIDKQTMFEKTFLIPLENILKCIGWSSEHIASLDEFFV